MTQTGSNITSGASWWERRVMWWEKSKLARLLKIFIKSAFWIILTLALAFLGYAYSQFLFKIKDDLGGLSGYLDPRYLRIEQLFAIALILLSAITVEFLFHLSKKGCVPWTDLIILCLVGYSLFFKIATDDGIHKEHEVEKVQKLASDMMLSKKNFFQHLDTTKNVRGVSKSAAKPNEPWNIYYKTDSAEMGFYKSISVDSSLFEVVIKNKPSYCDNESGINCKHNAWMAILLSVILSVIIRVKMEVENPSFTL